MVEEDEIVEEAEDELEETEDGLAEVDPDDVLVVDIVVGVVKEDRLDDIVLPDPLADDNVEMVVVEVVDDVCVEVTDKKDSKLDTNVDVIGVVPNIKNMLDELIEPTGVLVEILVVIELEEVDGVELDELDDTELGVLDEEVKSVEEAVLDELIEPTGVLVEILVATELEGFDGIELDELDDTELGVLDVEAESVEDAVFNVIDVVTELEGVDGIELKELDDTELGVLDIEVESVEDAVFDVVDVVTVVELGKLLEDPPELETPVDK